MADPLATQPTDRGGRRDSSYASRPVIISCPTTGDPVPTGVYVEQLSDLPPTSLMPSCLACAADHEWSAAAGTLASER